MYFTVMTQFHKLLYFFSGSAWNKRNCTHWAHAWPTAHAAITTNKPNNYLIERTHLSCNLSEHCQPECFNISLGNYSY